MKKNMDIHFDDKPKFDLSISSRKISYSVRKILTGNSVFFITNKTRVFQSFLHYC